jgi:drug/metabolite transporter (DMT)-like permease
LKKFYIVGFLMVLLFDTITHVSFKYAAMNAGEAALQVEWLARVVHQPWLYAALLSYFGAFLTYLTLLRLAPVGPAFAVTQLAVVTVLIYSVVFLGEHLSVCQIAGSMLIMFGICLLGQEPETVAAEKEQVLAQGRLVKPETTDLASADVLNS